MVRAFDRSRSSSFKFRKMFERQNTSESKTPMEHHHQQQQQLGSPLVSSPNNKALVSRLSKEPVAHNNSAKIPSSGEFSRAFFFMFKLYNIYICTNILLTRKC